MNLKVLTNPNRNYGLDILRAFAILVVVYEHGFTIAQFRVSKAHYDLLIFDGVSIFFVLSGFLIGQILIKTFQAEQPTFKNVLNFWLRRWFRTIPNYLLITAILGITYFYMRQVGISTVLKYTFFSQNLFYPHPDFFPEAWSLSVEEWFYLTIPLIIITLISFFSVKNKTAILITAIGIITLVTLYRFIHTLYHPALINQDWQQTYRKQVITRLDSLMYGILAAYIFLFHNQLFIKHKNKLFLIGIITLLTAKYFIGFTSFPIYNNVFSFAIESIGTAFLFPFLINIKTGKGAIYKTITFISIISYSMYLINYTLVQKVILTKTFAHFGSDFFTENNWFPKYILYWAVTIFLSYLIYICWERPTTHLREKMKAR